MKANVTADEQEAVQVTPVRVERERFEPVDVARLLPAGIDTEYLLRCR